jgi:hypothetical protein
MKEIWREKRKKGCALDAFLFITRSLPRPAEVIFFRGGGAIQAKPSQGRGRFQISSRFVGLSNGEGCCCALDAFITRSALGKRKSFFFGGGGAIQVRGQAREEAVSVIF